MHRNSLISTVLLGAALLVALLPEAGAQRRYYGRSRSFYSGGQRSVYTQQLARRIDLLEQRVRILERVVNLPGPDISIPTQAANVEDAERRLAEAEVRLKQSESMYRKGYTSAAKVEANRFERERARQHVRLSKAVRDGQPTEEIAAAIEVVGAEYYLAVAKRGLDLTQRLAAKGLATPIDIDAHKQAVQEAQERLDQARAQATQEVPEGSTAR